MAVKNQWTQKLRKGGDGGAQSHLSSHSMKPGLHGQTYVLSTYNDCHLVAWDPTIGTLHCLRGIINCQALVCIAKALLALQAPAPGCSLGRWEEGQPGSMWTCWGDCMTGGKGGGILLAPTLLLVHVHKAWCPSPVIHTGFHHTWH